MSLDRERIDALEAENDELRERISQLEAELYGDDWCCPVDFRLTRAEALLLSLLVKNERMSKELAHRALCDRQGADTEPKIVDVFICKARKKLAPFGVHIHTLWGTGYYLDAETRQALADGTFLQERAA
ncbi:winged helix-turn-helix domain-containing protein [Thalassovita mediterranea]|nr:winged helix-turn-helix domain-containing protein [Thalassovita mediterranea]